MPRSSLASTLRTVVQRPAGRSWDSTNANDGRHSPRPWYPQQEPGVGGNDMFGNTIGPGEILIVLVLALLIFGPKKLPELGKGIGEGFRALKDGMKDKSADEQAKAASTQAPSNPETKS